MTEFVLATANPDKAREIVEILGDSVGTIRPRPRGVPEVVEAGETLLDNARLKAQVLARATGLPAVADDTGLEVVALLGAPGVYSARFAGEHSSYRENVEKLIQLLEGVDERRARFRTVAVALWPDGREVVAEGQVSGHVPPHPRGTNGFGYDSVFVPVGAARTFAEMDAAEKHRYSHRGAAFRSLARQISG